MKTQSIKQSLLLIFLMAFQISFGQIVDDSFDPAAESVRLAPTPTSPEAQAFTKYGNTPVNMYTGTPNIQIPIYTHKGRELDLPISLTYDASGIKVEQIATNVGLGWNLNVGGRVTRLTNGMPDDFSLTSHTYGPYKSFWDNEVKTGITDYADLSPSPTFDEQQDVIDYLYFLKKCNDNEYDAQPDYFSFNALGNSDMIVIDVTSKTPTTLDNHRIKVSITKAAGGANTPITKWVVTTDDGTIYTFEEAEVTQDTNYNDIGPNTLYGFKKEFNSSWLLTKIESPNSKDIYEFTYTDLGFWTSNSLASSITGVTNAINCPVGGTSATTTMGFNASEYSIKQKVLNEISHNGKRIVDVNLLAERWDMTVDSAIENINIYDQDTGNTTSDLYKSYEFVYDYFRTSYAKIPPYNSGNIPFVENVRLKLNQIDIKDSNSALVKDYQFEYIDPFTISSTSSNSQDYYGYYNGISNSVLYPTSSDPCVPNGDGANRNSNFNSTKKGLLNKITYPTGGHTEFDYEANYEQEASGTSTVWQVVASTELDYPTSFPPDDPNACNNGSDTPATNSDWFQVTQNQTDYKMIYDQTGTLGGSFPTERRATLVKVANPTPPIAWADIYDSNCNIQAGIDVIWTLPFKQKTFPYSETITLDTGYYQLVLANPLSTFSNSFEAQEGVIVTNYNYNEKAGVRIKDIKDYTDATTLAFHKSYQYPSGTVISMPDYDYYSTQHSADAGGTITETTILHRVSYASGTDKPHMGYAEVIETIEDVLGSENNGTTSHRFNTNNAGNYFAGVYTYYINGKETAKQYGVTYYLGKPSGSTVYDSQDVPVSSSSNSYYDIEYYSNSGIYLHTDESKSNLYPIPKENVPANHWYIYYALPSGYVNTGIGVSLLPSSECNTDNFINTINLNDLCNPGIARLVKRTTNAWGKAGNILTSSSSQYFDTATNIVSQLTNYTYYDVEEEIVLIPGKPAVTVYPNYQLREQSSTSSEGETIKKDFLYAEHVNSGAGSLESANILNTPVQTIFYRDGNMVSNKKTIYNGTLPDTLKIAKGTLDLEARLLFERFENENLVEIKQVKGPTTAYVWGYDDRYVVAKVVNATYADIEALSYFGPSFTIASGLSQDQEDELRGLPEALVTTYEYDPIVGVTKITDPRKNIMTYEYDDFHRLKYIKDWDDKILSENKYNYGPQN